MDVKIRNALINLVLTAALILLVLLIIGVAREMMQPAAQVVIVPQVQPVMLRVLAL